MASFTCIHCGRCYIHEKGLKTHVRSSHTNQPLFSCDQCGRSFNRADNLQTLFQLLKKTFKLQKTREALEGSVQQFTVNLKEAKSLSTLEKAIAVFEPVMMDFQQKHKAYKFQIAVSIVFHKVVDPAVVTQPPVTLTSEMVDVYADAAPPLNDVNRQLLNFIEVYEQNGSGWVF